MQRAKIVRLVKGKDGALHSWGSFKNTGEDNFILLQNTPRVLITLLVSAS